MQVVIIMDSAPVIHASLPAVSSPPHGLAHACMTQPICAGLSSEALCNCDMMGALFTAFSASKISLSFYVGSIKINPRMRT